MQNPGLGSQQNIRQKEKERGAFLFPVLLPIFFCQRSSFLLFNLLPLFFPLLLGFQKKKKNPRLFPALLHKPIFSSWLQQRERGKEGKGRAVNLPPPTHTRTKRRRGESLISKLIRNRMEQDIPFCKKKKKKISILQLVEFRKVVAFLPSLACIGKMSVGQENGFISRTTLEREKEMGP